MSRGVHASDALTPACDLYTNQRNCIIGQVAMEVLMLINLFVAGYAAAFMIVSFGEDKTGFGFFCLLIAFLNLFAWWLNKDV